MCNGSILPSFSICSKNLSQYLPRQRGMSTELLVRSTLRFRTIRANSSVASFLISRSCPGIQHMRMQHLSLSYIIVNRRLSPGLDPTSTKAVAFIVAKRSIYMATRYCIRSTKEGFAAWALVL